MQNVIASGQLGRFIQTVLDSQRPVAADLQPAFNRAQSMLARRVDRFGRPKPLAITVDAERYLRRWAVGPYRHACDFAQEIAAAYALASAALDTGHGNEPPAIDLQAIVYGTTFVEAEAAATERASAQRFAP